MAKFVVGMNVSLDGYVDHMAFAPGSALFRHWIEQVRGSAGSLYGRVMYEIMRYWDEDHPEWNADFQAFAHAWRMQHKWVASRTLTSVGPNATLISDGVEATAGRIKQEQGGDIAICGTVLAASLAGLVDEYRLYLHPVVLGSGKPFFAGARPRLRLTANEMMDDDVVRLTYVPA